MTRPTFSAQITLGQLALDLRYGPPQATQRHEPTKIDHAETPHACRPFDGPENRYRERAAHAVWLEREIDQPLLAWPTPTCGTPRCLNPDHLDWQSPSHIGYPQGVCVYCGMSANTKDHLLPRTWTGDAARHHVITVPACLECNVLIADRYIPAVNERRRIAQDQLRKRNKRLLQMPDWTSEDIDQFGKTLRSTIERGLHDKKLIEARLAWPEDPHYDLRAMQQSGIENPYAVGLLFEESAA